MMEMLRFSLSGNFLVGPIAVGRDNRMSSQNNAADTTMG